MSKKALEHLEGYINTLEMHSKREGISNSLKVFYVGMVRGIKESIEISKKLD